MKILTIILLFISMTACVTGSKKGADGFNEMWKTREYAK